MSVGLHGVQHGLLSHWIELNVPHVVSVRFAVLLRCELAELVIIGNIIEGEGGGGACIHSAAAFNSCKTVWSDQSEGRLPP